MCQKVWANKKQGSRNVYCSRRKSGEMSECRLDIQQTITLLRDLKAPRFETILPVIFWKLSEKCSFFSRVIRGINTSSPCSDCGNHNSSEWKHLKVPLFYTTSVCVLLIRDFLFDTSEPLLLCLTLASCLQEVHTVWATCCPTLPTCRNSNSACAQSQGNCRSWLAA